MEFVDRYFVKKSMVYRLIQARYGTYSFIYIYGLVNSKRAPARKEERPDHEIS
jgi:hypothetical protein